MNEKTEGANKIVTCGLLFTAQLFSFMIRFAFGVVAPVLMEMYRISPKAMGYVLSGWNWSYTAGLPIMGVIVDRFGPYIVLGVGSLVWGLFTVALPIAASAVPLFLMRMVFGLGQTTLLPAGALAVFRGFSLRERARVIAVVFSGNQVGLAIGATVAAFILARSGWQAVFYCIGTASLLLTLGWFTLYPDKRIGGPSAALPDSLTPNPAAQTPWLWLLRHRSTWGIAFGQMGYLYAYFFFVSWLPGYLILERKMTLLQSGIIAALPFWAGLVGTLGGGWLGDYLIERGVSTTFSRKSIIGTGLSASTVFVVTAAYVEQAWVAVTLLTLCVGFLRLATGSVNSYPIDLAPRPMVGALTGIQNFFGNIGGLLAPIITGYIVNATGSFSASFVVAGGMALFGAASYVFIVDNMLK
ncbi:MAG: hypothetical protein AUH28_07295 [Acidobacteria bacterium 13_1_40CM_56_16]|nr:MAG: hypothetical protein AUH28_07295 [Acidobacteria bacterium 13_1_40CM_56_16]